MTYPICQTSLTQSRIKDFKNYLKSEDGDTTCPIPAAIAISIERSRRLAMAPPASAIAAFAFRKGVFS